MKNFVQYLRDWEANMRRIMGEQPADFDDIYYTTTDEELEYMFQMDQSLKNQSV